MKTEQEEFEVDGQDDVLNRFDLVSFKTSVEYEFDTNLSEDETEDIRG